MSGLDKLRREWEATGDARSGHLYGEALEAMGKTEVAATVYEAVIASGDLIGLADLGWLEHRRENRQRGQELYERYLAEDDNPDEQTALVSAILGHWRWHYDNRTDAEFLLRAGANSFVDARVDLANLLRATAREEEAEAVLREGVAKAELPCYLPLANLLDETDRSREAELLYRYGYEHGDAHCAYNLASLMRGQGRVDEAHEWLRRAADAGDDWAAVRLGELDA